jgi:hypothetical protein
MFANQAGADLTYLPLTDKQVKLFHPSLMFVSKAGACVRYFAAY